jgi:hypothetical protein
MIRTLKAQPTGMGVLSSLTIAHLLYAPAPEEEWKVEREIKPGCGENCRRVNKPLS